MLTVNGQLAKLQIVSNCSIKLLLEPWSTFFTENDVSFYLEKDFFVSTSNIDLQNQLVLALFVNHAERGAQRAILLTI